jgi:hypothetical protein
LLLVKKEVQTESNPKVVFSTETTFKAKINQNDILLPLAISAGKK